MWQPNVIAQRPCAIFDVDNPLIDLKSMFSFADFLQDKALLVPAERFGAWRERLKRLFAAQRPRSEINRFYYTLFEGVEVSAFAEAAQLWFTTLPEPDAYTKPAPLAALKALQQAGYNTILVSGSGYHLLAPFAAMWQVSDVLCAPQQQIDGCYTGELDDLPSIGQGKAHFIAQFLRQHQISADACLAFGDDLSDFPMLGAVNKGFLVEPLAPTLIANQDVGYEVFTTISDQNCTFRQYVCH